MFNIKRLLDTQIGQVLISILLGIGLATLFHKVCTDKSCLTFNGPVLNEIDGKVYKFGDMCYTYKLEPIKCDASKQTINIGDAPV